MQAGSPVRRAPGPETACRGREPAPPRISSCGRSLRIANRCAASSPERRLGKRSRTIERLPATPMSDSRHPGLSQPLRLALRALLFCAAAVLLAAGAAVFAGTPVSQPNVWRQGSFRDFAGGTFSDAGANAYVSAAGRIQTINRWDFNRDGHIDILCANSHPLLEMLDLSIYWGNGTDFSIRRHTYVPADGPMWVAIGDLNRDGRADLVSANYSNGTWTSMDSAIYWGKGTDGPASRGVTDAWEAGPFRGRTLLPSQNAQGVAIADLNRDGYPEIIFAFSAGFWEYRGNAKPAPSRIYWNQGGVFARDKYTELPVVGATDVDVADVNGDGWPDLAFSVGEGGASSLFFGGPAGFTAGQSVALPTRQAHAVRWGDVDGDGRIDVAFANEEGAVSWAYLNRDGRFAADRRLEFATHFAKDVVIADFNRDGRPDVFFANHLAAPEGEARLGNRFQPSYLYYGDARGFSPARRVLVQTIGAWGANAADLNNDGWPDLVVCNFQEHYSFEVPSFIYWGGPEGFDVTRRTPLYEHGAQGNAIADLNGDGHLDIVITSMMGRSRGDYDPSYLYLGNARGAYNPTDRLILPGREPYEQAMADLDDDGQVDVLLMNQGEVTRFENEVWVFWNQNNRLDPWRITGLPAYAGVGVEVADLDRDGHLDVIVANNKQYPAPRPAEGPPGKTAPGPARPGSFIYWGGPHGHAVSARTTLNIFQARSPSIADLNGDGHLDLVFAGAGASIFWGNG
ncbi:MAG: VCBS repeat-containing protein, partial [Verrucomicrobia bacterium]|nr:VCBS repeat-containing protein [Verrucomicrobiota bacterium]